MRGGDAAAIATRLRRLRLAPLRSPVTALPRPQVAFVWAPMTGGSPEIAALRPEVYWPGGRWVDWVGTSFYSRFPNFSRLTPFYETFARRRGKPFALAEWAMWGADDARFARRLFRWIAARPGVRMVSYNQGADADGPFRLRRYPRATRVIRRALAAPRYQAYAPEHR